MKKLVAGVQRFLRTVHPQEKELFERLATGQDPDVMFVACSDSRVVPHLITQSKPGELFVLRNAGNIVPASSAGVGAEAAAVEFAIKGLKVRDIVVCGHSQCGAMTELLYPEETGDLPTVDAWLQHSGEARRVVEEGYTEADRETRVNAAIEANVLVQIENLQSYEIVAQAREAGALRLHGWVWDIATGQVRAFDAETGEFSPL